ncbi:MAG TPA: phosphohistidine phosphatase SixA [Verrucomicrobiales bacterium]|nr:phosphohistidine phosphatase SixA [Verrucomicrobiales bacterium]
MISLYLLRHSNAAELPPKGEKGDAARRLTAEGIDKARRIGQALRRLGLTFDLVLSSPAVRARHTAELVVAELRPVPHVELLEALWIGGEFSDLLSRLRRLPSRPRSVLMVGHEPDLGRCISQFLAGEPHVSVLLKKGGLCKLTVAQLRLGRCATLEWFLAPRHLRLIAGEGQVKAHQ